MIVLGFNCILVPVCDIVYLGTLWPSYILTDGFQDIKVALYLIIIALAIIYISNILHSIFACATFRKDPLFQKYS